MLDPKRTDLGRAFFWVVLATLCSANVLVSSESVERNPRDVSQENASTLELLANSNSKSSGNTNKGRPLFAVRTPNSGWKKVNDFPKRILPKPRVVRGIYGDDDLPLRSLRHSEDGYYSRGSVNNIREAIRRPSPVSHPYYSEAKGRKKSSSTDDYYSSYYPEEVKESRRRPYYSSGSLQDELPSFTPAASSLSSASLVRDSLMECLQLQLLTALHENKAMLEMQQRLTLNSLGSNNGLMMNTNFPPQRSFPPPRFLPPPPPPPPVFSASSFQFPQAPSPNLLPFMGQAPPQIVMNNVYQDHHKKKHGKWMKDWFFKGGKSKRSPVAMNVPERNLSHPWMLPAAPERQHELSPYSPNAVQQTPAAPRRVARSTIYYPIRNPQDDEHIDRENGRESHKTPEDRVDRRVADHPGVTAKNSEKPKNPDNNGATKSEDLIAEESRIYQNDFAREFTNFYRQNTHDTRKPVSFSFPVRNSALRDINNFHDTRSHPEEFSFPIINPQPSFPRVRVPNYAVLDSDLVSVGDFNDTSNIVHRLQENFPPIRFASLAGDSGESGRAFPDEEPRSGRIHFEDEEKTLDHSRLHSENLRLDGRDESLEGHLPDTNPDHRAEEQDKIATFVPVTEENSRPQTLFPENDPPLVSQDRVKPLMIGELKNSHNKERFTQEIGPNGRYNFAYSTGTGIRSQEQGFLKSTPSSAGKAETLANVKQGSVTWTSPDGYSFHLTYEADEKGYRPQLTQTSLVGNNYSY